MRLYNESNEPVETRLSLAVLESKYQALLKWADDLPSPVVRGEHVSHHVATMQWVDSDFISCE